MDHDELLNAIRNLIRDIENRRIEKTANSLSLRESLGQKKLKESVEMIKKSFMLGSGGQSCPRCGGSGTI